MGCTLLGGLLVQYVAWCSTSIMACNRCLGLLPWPGSGEFLNSNKTLFFSLEPFQFSGVEWSNSLAVDRCISLDVTPVVAVDVSALQLLPICSGFSCTVCITVTIPWKDWF